MKKPEYTFSPLVDNHQVTEITPFLFCASYTYDYGIGGRVEEYFTTLEKGDKFTITHSDGAIITETIAEVKKDGRRDFLIICESCAVYARSEFKAMTIC